MAAKPHVVRVGFTAQELYAIEAGLKRVMAPSIGPFTERNIKTARDKVVGALVEHDRHLDGQVV